MRVDVRFGPQSYKAQSPLLAYKLCKNLFAERAEPGSIVPYALYTVPGVSEWVTVGVGPTRGFHVFNDELYVVSGSTLYKVAEDGTITALGGTVPGTTEELVFMEDNGFDLVIITGESDSYNGYYTNGTAAVAAIPDADMPPASWITFMNQHLIVGEAGTQKFYISAPADALDWDALDFASAENAPDDLVFGLRDHTELLLFGERTLEIWYNSGDLDFPFKRAPDGVVEIGCAAARSVAKLDNSVYWLAVDEGGLSIRRLEGRTPRIISHHGIDKALDEASTVADARAFTFTYRGHAYYVLTLPTALLTFIYDVSIDMWHERSSQDLGIWRPLGIASCYKQQLVVDSVTSKIGRLSSNEYREFGQQMPWEVTSEPVMYRGEKGSANRFHVEMETGTALRSGQGSNPIVFLSYSDDDGKTWSNELANSLGQTGQRRRLLTWTRLGASRKRIFRLRGADPIPTSIIQAWVDVS